MRRIHLLFIISVIFPICLSAQSAVHSLTINLTIDKSVQKEVKKGGRLFIFINQDPSVEPRRMMWPSPGNFIFAKNISSLDTRKSMKLTTEGWSKTPEWGLDVSTNDSSLTVNFRLE